MYNSVIPIGHGNFLPANKILVILSSETRSIKPIISKAELNQRLVKATKGRRVKAVILTTDNYVVLSSLSPKTLAERYTAESDIPIFSVGDENFLPNDKLTTILQKDSAPVKELVQLARAQDKVVDATMGHKTRAFLLTTSGYFLLSFLSPKALTNNFKKNNTNKKQIIEDDLIVNQEEGILDENSYQENE